MCLPLRRPGLEPSTLRSESYMSRRLYPLSHPTCHPLHTLFYTPIIQFELPREELNLLVIFWCTNEKSLLWNISFLFSIARFGGIVYCCPELPKIFRAAQCWNAPETPSDEDSIVIFWNLMSAVLKDIFEIKMALVHLKRFNFWKLPWSHKDSQC